MTMVNGHHRWRRLLPIKRSSSMTENWPPSWSRIILINHWSCGHYQFNIWPRWSSTVTNKKDQNHHIINSRLTMTKKVNALHSMCEECWNIHSIKSLESFWNCVYFGTVYPACVCNHKKFVMRSESNIWNDAGVNIWFLIYLNSFRHNFSRNRVPLGPRFKVFLKVIDISTFPI